MASGPFLFSESGTLRARCCFKVSFQAHSGRTVLQRIRSAKFSGRYLTRRPICTYGSLVFCVLHAFRVPALFRAMISAPRSVSAAWSRARPCFRSLFPVFGSYLFLCVSVRRREFVLVITNWNELISDT